MWGGGGLSIEWQFFKLNFLKISQFPMLTLIRLGILRVFYFWGSIWALSYKFCQIFSEVNTSHHGWGVFWLTGCQLLENAFVSLEFTKPSETKFSPGFYHHTPGRGTSLIPSREHLLENLFPHQAEWGEGYLLYV